MNATTHEQYVEKMRRYWLRHDRSEDYDLLPCGRELMRLGCDVEVWEPRTLTMEWRSTHATEWDAVGAYLDAQALLMA